MKRDPSIPPSHSLTIAVVCFVLGLLCLGFILSGCSRALQVGVVASGAADVVSTRVALNHGAVEANPLMRGSWFKQSVLKGLGIGTVLAGTAYLESKNHQTIGKVMQVVWIAANSVIAARNFQIARH